MSGRPAILTAITVPAAGWTFKFYISAAGAYDKTCTAVIPAGDYYMSGDNQADDLLYQLQLKAQAAIVATGGAFATLHYFYAALRQVPPETHRLTRLYFAGFTGHPQNHVKVAWTECSAGLVEALGYDASADDESTGVDGALYFNADYGHAYGWYSDDDGQLESSTVYDNSGTSSLQSVGFSDGAAKTVWLGENYTNEATLGWLPRALMYSDGTDYGDLPNYPMTRNKALECWWREARQGKQFRLYQDKQSLLMNAQDVVTRTADSTTTLTDSSKAWTTNRWKGCILRATSPTWRGVLSQEFYVSSNTDTVLTVPLAPPDGLDLWVSAETFTLWDHTYKTYVVDLNNMKEFAPRPMAKDLDQYGITIPLLRYV